MKSKYKSIKFESEEKFQDWLKKMTFKKIEFVDNMQDLLKIWIAKSGEILHCNLQASIWNGRFVNLNNLYLGKYIEFNCLDNNGFQQMDFRIEEIT